MKLLYDQNLSPKLVLRLSDIFPQSAHVDELGMGESDDLTIWNFAKANSYCVVSKDEDFNLFSVARGSPPKVIWLLLGNCSTTVVEAALRAELEAIQRLDSDPNVGTLVIR
jgi:predicted nuclease of predicted toxin-antitoxin system